MLFRQKKWHYFSRQHAKYLSRNRIIFMNLELYLFYCALIGLAGGALASFIGMGIGLFAIPFFLYTMPLIGIPSNILPHVVVCTVTACITFTISTTAFIYHKNNWVCWHLVRWIAPIGLIGIFLGTTIANNIPGAHFKQIIALLLLFCTAVSFIRSKKKDSCTFLAYWKKAS